MSTLCVKTCANVLCMIKRVTYWILIILYGYFFLINIFMPYVSCDLIPFCNFNIYAKYQYTDIIIIYYVNTQRHGVLQPWMNKGQLQHVTVQYLQKF